MLKLFIVIISISAIKAMMKEETEAGGGARERCVMLPESSNAR